jgi:hypothetical protein
VRTMGPGRQQTMVPCMSERLHIFKLIVYAELAQCCRSKRIMYTGAHCMPTMGRRQTIFSMP